MDAAFAIQKLLAEMLHAMSSIAQHIAILSQFFSHLHQALLAQSLEAMHTAVHMQGILCMHAGAIIGSMLLSLPFQQAACRRFACRRGVWGHGSALIKQALQSFGSLPTAWMSTKIPGQCSGWLAMMGVPCHWAVIGEGSLC